MPIIYDKEMVAKQLQKGIAKIAEYEGLSVVQTEHELASWILNMAEGGRKIQCWKNPSCIPIKFDDGHFFALIWRVLKTRKVSLDWLEKTLKGTGVPFYKPISSHLLYAYLEKGRVKAKPIPAANILAVIKPYVQNTYESISAPLLQELIPLEPISTRKAIKNASSIFLSGISLYRLIPAFKANYERTIERGVRFRVLLVDPRSQAIDMVALRSTSGSPVTKQRHQIEEILDLLTQWSNNIPTSNLQVRVLDYMPPYGITVYQHKSKPEESVCLVRLYTFRTPTSESPAIMTNPTENKRWFHFFSEQFEKMWDIGQKW